MELKHYIKILWRRKRIFFSIFLLILLIPLILSLLNKNIYKASARIILNAQDIQSAFAKNIPNELGKLYLLNTDIYYDSFLELLKDDSLLQKVINELQLNVKVKSFCSDYPYLNFLTFSQEVAIKVDRVEETDVYEISGFSSSPQEAETIANLYLEYFLKQYQEIYQELARKVKVLLQNHAKKIEREIFEAERDKKMFIAREGLCDFKTQISELYSQLSTYELMLHNIKIELESFEEKQNSILRILKNIPEFQKATEEISIDPGIVEAKRELVNLKISLAGSETEKSAEHPEIINLKNQIKSVNEELKTKISKYFSLEKTERNRYFDELFNQYRDNEIDKVEKQANFEITMKKVKLKNNEISKIAAKSIQFNRINNKIDHLRGYENSNIESLDGAMLVEKMNISNVNVIRYAHININEDEPYFPSWLTSMFLCGFLGFGFSFFFTLMIDYLDDSCKSTSEVEHLLNFPVMFSIPKISKDVLKKELIQEKHSPGLSASIWNLWSALKISGVKEEQRMIAITSCYPKEGKTTIGIFLAEAFLEIGQKVLLIEANSKRPVLAGLYSIDTFGSLDEFFNKSKSLNEVVAEIKPNMDFVAISKTDNFFRLIYSQEFNENLQNLKKHSGYDRIIIDLQSIDDDNSALVFSSNVDLVIFTTLLGKVNQKVLKKYFSLLKSIKKDYHIKIVTNN